MVHPVGGPPTGPRPTAATETVKLTVPCAGTVASPLGVNVTVPVGGWVCAAPLAPVTSSAAGNVSATVQPDTATPPGLVIVTWTWYPVMPLLDVLYTACSGAGCGGREVRSGDGPGGGTTPGAGATTPPPPVPPPGPMTGPPPGATAAPGAGPPTGSAPPGSGLVGESSTPVPIPPSPSPGLAGVPWASPPGPERVSSRTSGTTASTTSTARTSRTNSGRRPPRGSLGQAAGAPTDRPRVTSRR